MIKQILLLCTILTNIIVYAQSFYEVSNDRELISSVKNTSDLFIVKLRASTLNPEEHNITLESWIEEKFYKPQTLGGKTYSKTLSKYKIDKRYEKLVLVESIAYNNNGKVVFNQSFYEYDYKDYIPGSVGEEIVKQSSLIYEIFTLVNDPEFIKATEEEESKSN